MQRTLVGTRLARLLGQCCPRGRFGLAAIVAGGVAFGLSWLVTPSLALAQESPIDLLPPRELPRISAGPSARARHDGDRAPKGPAETELQLVRLVYESQALGARYFAYGRSWERWETDFPQAEENFAVRLQQLSRVLASAQPIVRRLTDDDLFTLPFLYVSDVGWMELSGPERARLREYLLRGGFVWVDDFWGDGEWLNFERVMRQVLPDFGWREISPDHPLLHMAFDLAGVPQIPARDYAARGFTSEPPEAHRAPAGQMDEPHLRGWFDASGRLMLVATHNTDIGDGMEREAYGQDYFETYSTRAYALAVNIVLYALTH